VPAAAITRDTEGAAVYVVSGDEAARITVTTGIEVDGVVEVLTGLADGQQVLVTSTYGLGAKVRLAKTS
jgi:hypothetical protein